MLKYIVASSLVLGCVQADDFFSAFNDEIELYGESAPFLSGVANLFAHEYLLALEDFDRASVLASTTVPEMEFLVLFGKTVAYDNLEMRSECERSIGALFILSANYEDDEEEDDDEDDTKSEEFMEVMRKMALLTPSADIRKVLLTIVKADND